MHRAARLRTFEMTPQATAELRSARRMSSGAAQLRQQRLDAVAHRGGSPRPLSGSCGLGSRGRRVSGALLQAWMNSKAGVGVVSLGILQACVHNNYPVSGHFHDARAGRAIQGQLLASSDGCYRPITVIGLVGLSARKPTLILSSSPSRCLTSVRRVNNSLRLRDRTLSTLRLPRAGRLNRRI
jgi:hypothetical protein